MIKRLLLQVFIGVVLFICFTGCTNSNKFDREKWSFGDGIDYPVRKLVLDDLVKNHHIKGLTYHQLIDSLGSPQGIDQLTFTYQIINTGNKYNPKLKPVHIKNLLVYMGKDSIVTKFEIQEYDKKVK